MISAISVSVAQAAGIPDLTEEGTGTHAIQCLVEDVEIALRNALRCPLIRQPSRRFFDIDPGARERAQLALGAALPARGEKPSHVLVSAPGLVIRPGRSGDNACEASHELTVLRIRTGRPLTAESVDVMVHTVLPAVLPEHSFRIEELGERDARDAVRVTVEDDEGVSVPVGACGIVHASALSTAHAHPWPDAPLTTMLVLELNLDALLMLRKGIDDVRLLRSSDPHLARQMRDLGRFRAPIPATQPAGSPEPTQKPAPRRGNQNEIESVTRPDPAA
jgi:phenylalanyl-tRNA synthetase alpha chain